MSGDPAAFAKIGYFTRLQKERDRAEAHRFQWTVTTNGEFFGPTGEPTYVPSVQDTFDGGRAILIKALNAWFKREFERGLHPEGGSPWSIVGYVK